VNMTNAWYRGLPVILMGTLLSILIQAGGWEPVGLRAQEIQDDEFVPEGRYLLRWGWQAGQRFQVQATQEVVIETMGQGIGQGPMPATLQLFQDWEVMDRDDKKITVEQTFRRVRMEMTYPVVGEIVADTDEPAPDGPIAQQVHANIGSLVGKRIRLQMSRLGEVTKYEFVEEPGTDVDSGAVPLLSKDNLQSAIGQMIQFPEYSLAPGDTWGTSVKRAQPGGGSAVVTAEYTFHGPMADDSQRVRITVVPTLELTSRENAIQVESQSSQGEVIYDLQRRHVLETKLTQELVIALPGDPPIKRRIETSVRMTVKPIDSPSP